MKSVIEITLRAFVRLLVAKGIGFPDAAETLKKLYIKAAQDLTTDGKLTDSRISVMTGLQRRDVARLRNIPEPADSKPNHQVRLMALWQTDPAYKDHPTLPRTGPAPSFEALSRDIRKDVHPRTVLEHLLTADAVSYDADTDHVRLEQSSYQPMAGSDDQMAYLAQNLADHSEAAVQNVLTEPSPYFDRSVHYNNLPKEAVLALQNEYHHGQMKLLKALNQKAARLQTDQPGYRFRAGGYFFHQKQDTE
ncbi:DUF6502 family protein [Parasulfitobacter algicola]|uniref:Uncharacterized protein n=1 Tax=Parasulfitobacter algicola TaxID=2614809 RepID=A0ABX2IUH9_9RHOB|nr:DUF6502 family protein [Sulfitobacter algicola]NSX53708.1 hypothetical protein [Sulfitobacter algicola]